MKNILVFKLRNGTDIIASVVEEKTTKKGKVWTLDTPYQIVPLDTFDEEGKPKGILISMSTWMIFSEDTIVSIEAQDVLVTYKPTTSLKTLYLSRKDDEEDLPIDEKNKDSKNPFGDLFGKKKEEDDDFDLRGDNPLI